MQVHTFSSFSAVDPSLLKRIKATAVDYTQAQAAEQGPPANIIPDNHPSQIYATVKVKGEVVATIYNSGAVESSNALGARINALVKNDKDVGPVLAQSRADRIASMLGGSVEKADTALTQSAWKSWSTERNQKLSDYYNTTITHIAAQDSASTAAEQAEESEISTTAAKPSAADEFRDFMKKSPMERMVDQILKSMGLTREDLEAMPPEKQQAVMKKVQEIIEQKIREGTGIAGQTSPETDTSAAQA